MITGAKRSFAEQTGNFAFQFDITTTNLNQLVTAGISGLNNLTFNFLNGKIYDPNNYYVGSYQSNLKVSISGQVAPNSFDYYINNNLIAIGQPKSTGSFHDFFVSTISGNSVNFNTSVVGIIPQYNLNNNIIFIPGQLATGEIINQESFNSFRLFSGSSFTSNINYSGNTIGLIHPNNSGLYYLYVPNAQPMGTYTYPIQLITNFGNITQNITLNAGITGTGIFTNLNLYPNFGGISGLTGTTGNNNGPLLFTTISGLSYINTPYLDIYLLTTGTGWNLKTGLATNNLIDFQANGYVTSSGFKNPNPQINLIGNSTYIEVDFISPTGFGNQLATLVITGYNTGIITIITGNRI